MQMTHLRGPTSRLKKIYFRQKKQLEKKLAILTLVTANMTPKTDHDMGSEVRRQFSRPKNGRKSPKIVIVILNPGEEPRFIKPNDCFVSGTGYDHTYIYVYIDT
jgi:hypothetical protein